MGKKVYRFYGGLLSAQERWLNRMSAEGFRLIYTEKLLYEFESCEPGQYQYCVEFVGEKSKKDAEDYRDFLSLGYQAFFKNMNLNYSIGKVRLRPWAEGSGMVATNRTTFNRELLIVEKENDGKKFELHTTNEDKAAYYKRLRAPWLSIFALFLALGMLQHSIWLGICSLLPLIPIVLYQIEIVRAAREAKSKEW